MLVENKSKRMYVHSILNSKRQAEMLILNPGEHAEIPDEVALQWIKTGEVIKYADPVAVEKEKAAKEKEVAALKAEIERLKAEAKSIDDLKKEADELGISYAKNIGAAKLQEKIDKFKEEK